MKFNIRAIGGKRGQGFLGTAGSVAVELAVVAPFLLVLIIGVIDFAVYFNQNQAVAAATRVGAEYARDNAICQSSTTGIDGIASTINSPCLPNITNAVTGSVGLTGATVAATLVCQCDDGTGTACTTPCATTNLPRRLFISVNASQPVSPLLPFPGFPPAAVATSKLQIGQ